ncbi:SMG8 protein [Sarcoptes scabiei]|nr:SMG8 protein [Sarcoptes scabiei]
MNILIFKQRTLICLESRENMKIIWLVRDPRSIMSSRLQLQWCKEMLNCTNSTVLCHKIESNIDSLESIEDNPRLIQSIRLIRYEDLIEDIYGSIKELFDYLGISKIPYEWINRHTSKDDILRNPHSTYRNIRKQKLTKAHWYKRLTSEFIEDIESVCSKVMSQLGFDLLDQASTEDFAEKSLLRTYYPLQRFSIQIKKNKD